MLLTIVFRYAGIALQFLILMAIARGLNPHDYGQYLFVLSAVLPTYFLLGLGASETFVREAPRLIAADAAQEASQLAGATLRLAIGSAIALGVVGGGVIAAIAPPAGPAVLLWFMLLFFIANGLMFNCAQLLLGHGAGRLGAFFFYPAINVSLLLSSLPYVMLSPAPGFAGLAWTTSSAALVVAGIALLFVIVRVRPARPVAGMTARLVRSGLALAAARALYGVGLWLPTFVAGLLLSPTEAGYLGTAGRLAVAVAAVTSAVRFAVRPAIVRAFARDDLAEIRAICGSLATATFTMACVALLANVLVGAFVVRLVFGPGFAPVAPLLSILLLAVAAESFGGPVDEVLKMTHHERRILQVFAIAVPALAAALFLAARAGIVAMAMTQAVYSAAVFGALILVARRSLGIWLHPTVPRLPRRAGGASGR